MAINGIYGLSHIGLSHFHSMCKQENLAYAIASPNGVELQKLGEEKDPYPVIVLSVVNFLKLHKRFKKKDVCVFIVDNPVQLESVGATILGCTKLKSYHYRFFPVKSNDIRLAIESCGKEPVEFTIKKTRVVYEMMQAASAESIMSPLQTAFYLIKNVESRNLVQDVVFDWLAVKAKEEKVKKILNEVGNEDVKKRILDLMVTGPFIRLRKAADAVLSEKTKFEVAANKFKVPMYDLKYVVKKVAARQNLTLPG